MHLIPYQYVRTSLDKIKTWLGDSPNYVSKLAALTYADWAGKWAASAEGRRVCRTVIAINSVIWLAWQIPRLRPIMTRHFLHYPLSGLSHTLLTSVFRLVRVLIDEHPLTFSSKQPQGFVTFGMQQYGIEWIW